MSQHIQNIEISNFKSIKDLKISGCKKINIFAGKPNAGKSNILEGIGLFGSLGLMYPINLRNIVRFEKLSDLFFEANLLEPSMIKISDETPIYIRFFENGLTISDNKEDYRFPITRFEDLGEENLEGSFKNYSLNKKIKKYSFNSSVNNKFYLESDILSIPFGNNISNIISSNSEIRNFVNKILKDNNLKIFIERHTTELRIFKEYEDGTVFSLPYSMIADTLQRLIFYKTAIMSNHNSVLLFEEPEAHCFEPYILEFTNEVKFNKNDNQFFIVTHSDFIIQEFLRDEESRKDTQIYLVNNVGGKTEVKALEQEKNEDVYEYNMNVFFNFDNLWETN